MKIRGFFLFSSMKRKGIVYLVLFLTLLVLFAWLFTNIFFYLVIGAILTAILRPLTNYISQTQFLGMRVPRAIAVILSFVFLSAIFVVFITLFIPVFTAQLETISALNYSDILARISRPFEQLEDFIISISIEEREKGFLLEEIRSGLVQFVQDRSLAQFLNNLISYTGTVLISFIAVVFITFFMLYEDGLIRRKFISMIPNQYFEVTISAITKIEALLSNYLTGLLIQMLSVFTLASLGLSLLGIKFALTIALFAAVANLIPYLGPVLGGLFGIVVAVSTSAPLLDSPNAVLILILKILFVFGIVQLTDNLVLQPLIFSRSVKAHPLEIFVVIFAGAGLAGILGMIAAIPTYTILRVSAIELYSGYKQYKIFKSN